MDWESSAGPECIIAFTKLHIRVLSRFFARVGHETMFKEDVHNFGKSDEV